MAIVDRTFHRAGASETAPTHRAAAPAGITLDGVEFGYGESDVVVREVSLAVLPGEFFTLIGPSGCGKTTILRLVAGLLAPRRGRVLIGGEDVTDAPTHRRGVGLVFQNYALFPHMTVAENVGYGLKTRKAPREAIAAAVASALEMVGMGGAETRYPGELSGGQQQRVGLARAVASQPRVMLLDEPLSNLDAKLREQMCLDTAELQRRLKMTVLYVTHDQGEALAMSDRIAVMRGGRLHEIGPPRALYERPATLVAATFLGNVNILRLTRDAETYRCEGGAPLRLGRAPRSAQATAMIRPEALRVGGPDEPSLGPNVFPGTVIRRVYRGATDELLIAVDAFAKPLHALVLAKRSVAEGQAVAVALPPDDIHVLEEG